MSTKLITRPHRTGGPSSLYWEFYIPSTIVKEYGINETTNFLIEYGDYGITFYYANIERKMGCIDLGLDNFGQSIPSRALGEN
jgi:hypothetical protein